MNKAYSDGESLLLASGQLSTSGANLGFKAIGEVADEPAVGLPRGGDDLRARRLGLSVRDVLSHGTGKQYGFLCNHADPSSQRFDIQAVDVFTVDGDRALGWVIETEEQGSHGRFATA